MVVLAKRITIKYQTNSKKVRGCDLITTKMLRKLWLKYLKTLIHIYNAINSNKWLLPSPYWSRTLSYSTKGTPITTASVLPLTIIPYSQNLQSKTTWKHIHDVGQLHQWHSCYSIQITAVLPNSSTRLASTQNESSSISWSYSKSTKCSKIHLKRRPTWRTMVRYKVQKIS